MNTLNWKEELLIDESYEKINYDEYSPHTGIDLNNVHGDIRIVIRNQDQFLLPSKSYLNIEAQLLKENGEHYVPDDKISLGNNGLMYLFDRVSYHLSNREIESYANPGIASTVKGLVTYPGDYLKGTQFLWKKDNSKNTQSNSGFNARHKFVLSRHNNGEFSCSIPLSHIFGFCENYEKIMYGVEHTLILRRNHDSDAIIKSNEKEGNVEAVPRGKIIISKLSWHMPHAKISDEYKIPLYEQIENKTDIPIRFLNRQCERYTLQKNTKQLEWKLNVATGAEKPRYVFLVFQNGRLDNQNQNSAIFDHMGYRNAYCQINGQRYPDHDLDVDFKKNKYIKAFNMLCDYSSNVVGHEQQSIGILDFENLFPILVFDLSHQSERIKNTPVDVTIKVDFTESIANDNIEAYAVILSDRFIKLQSDGNKMNVIH